jgi:hypothetical protein
LIERVIVDGTAMLTDAPKEGLAGSAKRTRYPTGRFDSSFALAVLEDELEAVIDNSPVWIKLNQEPI